MSRVRFRYQTLELGEHDFHLRTLRDSQQCPEDLQDADDTGVSTATWPLFGVLWQSEELLSTLMLTHKIGGLRILEVGCGTGLASIVLRHRGANITATDYNPDAAKFLEKNTTLNELEPINCICENWQDEQSILGRFDLIIGSDLLYDRHNLGPLVTFLNAHTASDGDILIVDPRRGLTQTFIRQIEMHGFTAKVTTKNFQSMGKDDQDYLVIQLKRNKTVPTAFGAI